MTTVAEWNAQVFRGRLSAAVMGHLSSLDQEREEVRAFVDRAFRLLARSRHRAEDVSPFFGWALGTMAPRILPGVFGGLVPPITLDRRHVRFDDYVALAFPREAGRERALLDLGCGFPPLATVNTAERFPDWAVTGADPTFDRYLVLDAQRDYACFGPDGSLRYFQAAVPDPARWEALHRDPAATRERFFELLVRLRPRLVGSDDSFAWAEEDGARLERHPIQRFLRPNLCFVVEELLPAGLPPAAFDVIRCMNVFVYFDARFRQAACDWVARRLREGGVFLEGLDWAHSTVTRYRVYRCQGGRLCPQEFAFSLDNLRPIQLAQVFTLQEDDRDAETLSRVVGLLRSDEGFRRDLDAALDELHERERLFRRLSGGYVSDLLTERPPREREAAFEAVERALVSRGFVERAAAVLERAGLRAWRNPVGHLAVDPYALEEAT